MSKVINYHAVSLTEYADGSYQVISTKIDQASRRVVPELIDSGEYDEYLPPTTWEMLLAAVSWRVAQEMGLSTELS